MKRFCILSVVLGLFAVLPMAANAHFFADSIVVPLGGNTWANNAKQQRGLISNNGIKGWSDDAVVFNTYVRINTAGELSIQLNGNTSAESRLRITVNNSAKEIEWKAGMQKVDAGYWKLTRPGYYAISLQGLKKKGDAYPSLAAYTLSGTAVQTAPDYVSTNEGNFFYWGRRGPSVHLSYPFPDSIKAEYFYNEVTVKPGNDVIGSYYMANGFGEGYFGMQVNSATERRILFSVWSPFQTDDPKAIPEDQKIVLLKKGEGVHTGEFGNEGSGGQSYLRYNWITGNTYKFLLKGVPDGPEHTIYTAWFFAPEKNNWQLIASFRRPKKSTYLTRFHSFLENFSPDQGDKERKVEFNNQWIRDNKGQWHELTHARFTGDNTARKGYRMDYGGGVAGNVFFLRNCGFFTDNTALDASFSRKAGGKNPVWLPE